MKIGTATPELVLLHELGERAQKYRVGINLSQAELAKSAGVSQRTIERLEAGSSVQLENMIRVLRALRLTSNLDQLIPETSVQPIQLAGSKTDTRRRSSKRRAGAPTTSKWVWADEK